MTTAVIGATGRVGSEIVRGVIARGEAVTALLVRDPGRDGDRRGSSEPSGAMADALRRAGFTGSGEKGDKDRRHRT